ncbi:uncharacterized protein CLUP02_16132 [Colletotrichum lupini]|uniref:Uncharacterized protein n=1 Tax=Colletotrichum lupini TaxID=145971 RepID=A0A9Q8T9C6_9PEZI|nr:uncharacterized protein CLUP02_16132 [Colletotrichum lupini]UQC90602.1 hypothetical protein CLUP02_16132 [Colletotrichum lupini]
MVPSSSENGRLVGLTVADRPDTLTKRHFIRRRAAVGQSSFAVEADAPPSVRSVDVSNNTSAYIPLEDVQIVQLKSGATPSATGRPGRCSPGKPSYSALRQRPIERQSADCLYWHSTRSLDKPENGLRYAKILLNSSDFRDVFAEHIPHKQYHKTAVLLPKIDKRPNAKTAFTGRPFNLSFTKDYSKFLHNLDSLPHELCVMRKLVASFKLDTLKRYEFRDWGGSPLWIFVLNHIIVTNFSSAWNNSKRFARDKGIPDTGKVLESMILRLTEKERGPVDSVFDLAEIHHPETFDYSINYIDFQVHFSSVG